MHLLQRLSGPYTLFTLFFILFIFLRVIQLPQRVEFASDQGRDFLTTFHLYKQKEITLIGPPSEYTVNGHQFFFGPASYYVILPTIALSNGNVLVVSYWLILLNTICFLITLLLLLRFLGNTKTVWIFALFLTITPVLIHDAQSYWNPYLMLPTATLLVGLLVKTTKKTSSSLVTFLLIGLCMGIGMQFHYAFILPIILSVIWLGIMRKLLLSNLLFLFLGFCLGISPLILFELRNQFYNTQTFFWVFQQIGASSTKHGFTWNGFYFLGLLPFLFFFLAIILEKITRKHVVFLFLTLGVYALWSLYVVISTPLPQPSYTRLQKLAQHITNDTPTSFNIVDQKTSDNRALALRYLLTVQNNAPMDVSAYPQAQTLYIYSDKPLSQLTKNPVWEIASFFPYKTQETMQIDKNLFLYKLSKK